MKYRGRNRRDLGENGISEYTFLFKFDFWKCAGVLQIYKIKSVKMEGGSKTESKLRQVNKVVF